MCVRAVAMGKRRKGKRRSDTAKALAERSRAAELRRKQYNETTWPYIVDEVERARVMQRVARKAEQRRALQSAPPVVFENGRMTVEWPDNIPPMGVGRVGTVAGGERAPTTKQFEVVVDPVAVEACIRAEREYYGTPPDADAVEDPVQSGG